MFPRAFFCFCVLFLFWNLHSFLDSSQVSICRKSHSSHTFPFPSFHVSSQRSRSQIEHPSHAFHHPHSPILRLPVLYLDETKSPRFPPFFVCSQIQISCELEIAGRWPWMVMWISPGFSSRVASAVRRRQSGVFEVYETCRASIFWQCVRIWGLSQRCFIQ